MKRLLYRYTGPAEIKETRKMPKKLERNLELWIVI